MKISCLFAAALAAVNLLAAEPVATSVTARQRYPWNGKVDIVVTFSGASNDVAETGCVLSEDLPSSARTARASDSWGGMRPPIERCR